MEDFVTVVLVIVLLACIVFIVMYAIVQGRRVDTCQAEGYAWSRAYASTFYCVRIEDERLIGVPLATFE